MNAHGAGSSPIVLHLVGFCQLGELRVRLAGIVGASAQQPMIIIRLSESSMYQGGRGGVPSWCRGRAANAS